MAKHMTEQEPCDDKDWRFYFNHGYAQAKRDLQRSCEDAISRQALLDKLNEWDWQELYLPIHFKENIIDELPSVQPSHKGHWIEHRGYDIAEYGVDYSCSECNKWVNSKSNFCPKCGADMRGAE